MRFIDGMLFKSDSAVASYDVCVFPEEGRGRKHGIKTFREHEVLFYYKINEGLMRLN